MCLSIPGKIESIDGEQARVSVGGSFIQANISLVDGVQVGDYILVHSGFALQKIDEQEAEATLGLFKDYEEFNKLLDQEEQDWRNQQS